MTIVHVPQIYYWKVEFEDGTELAQFDQYGNEILIRNIIGKDQLQYNPKTQQDEIIPYSNFFSEYEKIHGKVKMFSWLPFTEEQMATIHKKDPSIVFAKIKDAHPITKEIPNTHFATFNRVNLISYGLDENSGVSGKLGKLVIGVVDRQTKIASMYEINVVQVKA